MNAIKLVRIAFVAGVLLAAGQTIGAGFSSPPWPDGTTYYPKQPYQRDRALDAETATTERARVLYHIGVTNQVTNSFWKFDRTNFRRWKSWVGANCSNFVDPSAITSETLNAWFAVNTTSNRPPMLTTNRLSEICGLATNFWDTTPWRSLATNPTNGWPVVSNVMSKLLYTVAEYSAATGTVWGYFGETNFFYSAEYYETNAFTVGSSPGVGKTTRLDTGFLEFDTIMADAYLDVALDAGAVTNYTPRLDWYGAQSNSYVGVFNANGSEMDESLFKRVSSADAWAVTFDDLAVGAWGDADNQYNGWVMGDAFFLLYWGGANGFQYK